MQWNILQWKIIVKLLNNVLKEALLKYDEIQTRIYMRSAYYFVQPMKISALMQKNYQYVCQHFTATVFNSKNIMNIS